MKKTDLLNLSIVSLISSDTCIDKESCERSIELLNGLKEKLETDFELEGKELEKYKEKIDQGIEIVKKDLEQY